MYNPFSFKKNDAVEILVIADRSGSMQSIEKDAVGGFNAFLKEQKSIEGEARLSLVLFDDQYEMKLDSVPLAEVTEIESLGPRGMTAMNDAIGRAMNSLFEKDPEKAIICILTDGQENASREYNNSQIKEMIQKAEKEKGWQVIYLAANQDGFSEGASRGISKSNIFNYNADANGINDAYKDLSFCVRSYRQNTSNTYTDKNTVE